MLYNLIFNILNALYHVCAFGKLLFTTQQIVFPTPQHNTTYMRYTHIYNKVAQSSQPLHL